MNYKFYSSILILRKKKNYTKVKNQLPKEIKNEIRNQTMCRRDCYNTPVIFY